ncbi:hypothetical protein BKA64DRAFT_714388 [Cadophora sp. MPI-SDFR-AT-0126]|nr:hypothetical protein BKA64DRAFT_714388 [Leotiomycetes sp. MPI-SDFR-AT-0126]
MLRRSTPRLHQTSQTAIQDQNPSGDAWTPEHCLSPASIPSTATPSYTLPPSRISRSPSPVEGNSRGSSLSPDHQPDSALSAKPLEPYYIWEKGQVRDKDVKTLDDGEWLNDEIVNCSMAWALANHKDGLLPDNPDFLTFKEKTFNLQKDYYAFPVHHDGNRWVLVAFCRMKLLLASGTHDQRPTVLLMDSLDTTGNSIYGPIATTLWNFIGVAYSLIPGRAKAQSNITLDTILVTNFKKQTNGFDCGIFPISFLEKYCADPENFLQQDRDNTFIDLEDAQQKRASLRANFEAS